MNLLRPSRRQMLHASLVGGIAVYLAPLGSKAFAALFEEQLLTRPQWNDGVLKYRIDGTSKVTGEKVFARDIRARDMPHWPQQQSHPSRQLFVLPTRSDSGGLRLHADAMAIDPKKLLDPTTAALKTISDALGVTDLPGATTRQFDRSPDFVLMDGIAENLGFDPKRDSQ